jgi:hypothetical protein
MKHREKIAKIGVSGWFDVVQRRNGTIIRTMAVPNGASYEGMAVMLNACFAGGSGFTNLYVGLVKFLNPVDTPTAVPTIGDTLGSNGWKDFEFTSYAAGSRPGLSFSSTGSAFITGGSVSYDIEDGANLQGFFVCTDGAKGSFTGTLWASAIRTFFTEGKSFLSAGSEVSDDFVVLNGDQLSVTYSVRLSPIDS